MRSSVFSQRQSSFVQSYDDRDLEPLILSNTTTTTTALSKRQARKQHAQLPNNYSSSVIRRVPNYLSTRSKNGKEEMTSLLETTIEDDYEDTSMITTESNPLLSSSSRGRNFDERRPRQKQQFISPAALESMRQRARQQQQPRREEYPIHRQTASSAVASSSSLSQLPGTATSSTCNGCVCIQCIRTTETGVREYCGAFHGLLGPGWYCILPPCGFRIVSRVSLRVQQLDITISNCKTKDSVFLPTIALALQCRAVDAYQAVHYRTHNNAKTLIHSLVQDIVRSTVAQLPVERIFSDRTWTEEVHKRLIRPLEDFGYELDTIPLVTEITVDPKVRTSMNDVNASRRLKHASSHKAEAFKVERVKKAQADAEKSYLQGVGLARARMAIVSGLKATLVENEKQERDDKINMCFTISNEDIMNILLVSQYMDTLTDLGRTTTIGRDGSSSMVVCSDPSQVALLSQQLTLSEQKTTKPVMTQEEINMHLLENI